MPARWKAWRLDRGGASPVVALMALAAIAGCANGTPRTIVAAEPLVRIAAAEAGSLSSSALGQYLAARQARAGGDTGAAAEFFLHALEADPDNQRLLRETFAILLAGGRMEEATELAARLVETNARAGLANVVLGVAEIKAGHFGAARERLRKTSKRQSNALLVPLLTAWAELGQGETDAAVEALSELSRNQSFDPYRSFHGALVNDVAGRAADAEEAFRATLAGKRSGAIRVALALGNFLERQERRAEAKEVYRAGLAEDPDDPLIARALDLESGAPVPARFVATIGDGAAEALYGVAATLAADGAYEAAANYARLAIDLKTEFPAAQMLLGNLLESGRRWSEAAAAFEGIDLRSPYSWDARIRVAVLLDRRDRVDEAIVLLRSLADERPASMDALIALGDLYREKEQWPEAVAEYDRAAARVGTPTENAWALFYTRGIALERARQWPRAEADFLRALELRPEHPLVLNYLGYSWVDQGLHLERALGMIKKAVELRPRDGYIIDSLGWVLYRMDRFGEAVKNLERAVELRPTDPVINDHLGDAYWRVGRTNEARFQWRRALSLKPEADTMPTIRRKIEEGLPADGASEHGG